MRSFDALRKACVFGTAAIAFAWADSASSLSCSQPLTAADVVRLGLVDDSIAVPTGGVEIARSPSGTYSMKVDPAGDPLAVRLYRGDMLVASFRRPMPSVLDFLLDDGTYVAFEQMNECIPGLDQDVAVVSPTGIVVWRHEARALVPERYVDALKSSVFLSPPLGWMVSARLVGSERGDAKLSVRLTSYDEFEIAVADARTRLVEITDFGTDAAAWRGRAYWHRAMGDDESSLQSYLRAQALDADDVASLSAILEIYEGRKRYDLVEAQLLAAIARRPLSSALAGGPHFDARTVQWHTVGHPLWLHRELAELYVKTGDVERALNVLDEVLRLFPDDWSGLAP